MAEEIELKLALSPAAADRLEASGLLPGDPPAVQQISTYFDTSDHAVAKAGFSLRIRRTGAQRVQTIKADGTNAAGLFIRSEWERPVENDVPVLDFGTSLPMVLGKAADAVAPAFEVRIARRTWIISDEAASIELVLDRGEVMAAKRRSAFCELELELKSGDRAALFTLARKIDGVAPVRLGVLTKSERGYRLIGSGATSVKAAPVVLTADMPAAQAFRRILAACLRQFRLNETLFLEAGDPAALHQARVALRRLRSALAIFKPIIGKDGAAVGEELRWFASLFGEARDLDVLGDHVASGALRDCIAAAREAAYDRARTALESARARGLMLDLAAWAATDDSADGSDRAWGGDQSARAFAEQALGRFRRRIKREGRDLAGLDDEARHNVRKDAKTLRYATEFFASLFVRKREQRRCRRFLSRLEALQDRLGMLNDLVAAPGVLAKAGIGADAAVALLERGPKKKELLDRAETALEDLVDTKIFW